MNKIFSLTVVMIVICQLANGQALIASLEESDFLTLINRPTKVLLASGEELTGKFGSGVLKFGYLDKITLKKDNGEKISLKPEDVVRLSIQASKMAKVSMMVSSAPSILAATKRDFNEIKNREYIIFETAMRSNKKGTLRLMQLLNPGFDSKIKVFADPNAMTSSTLAVKGVQLAGGEDKSFLMVQNDSKAVVVRKATYAKNFEELYKACPEMVKNFSGSKVKWEDMAGHVFAFDQICKN